MAASFSRVCWQISSEHNLHLEQFFFQLHHEWDNANQLHSCIVPECTSGDGGWSFVTNVGGGVAVNHQFNDTLTGGVYYSLTHSFTGGAAIPHPDSIAKVWASACARPTTPGRLEAALAASFESAGLSAWTPTGNLYVSKSFRWNGKASAAYSRTQAAQIYASAGYFDQADIVYRQPFGKKAGLSVSAGEFRTINNTTHATGKRAGTSFSYLLLPRVSLNAAYNYSHQSGTSTTFFQGTTNYFT